MNKKKPAEVSKPGARINRKPEPPPRKPETQSECSTTELITGLPRELGAVLRGQKRRGKD